MSIEVKDLLKVYGTQKAVNNISFAIGKGEIVGFLGPNGAGKSNFISLFTFLQNLQEDEATCLVITNQSNIQWLRSSSLLILKNNFYQYADELIFEGTNSSLFFKTSNAFFSAVNFFEASASSFLPI